MSYLIIARHAGLVEWLARHGIEGEVISHATPEQVNGRDVVGVLPLNLAAVANTVTAIDLPNLAPELRGKELTPEQMDAAGAALARYSVTKLA